jgi:hypothetical protein
VYIYGSPSQEALFSLNMIHDQSPLFWSGKRVCKYLRTKGQVGITNNFDFSTHWNARYNKRSPRPWCLYATGIS